MRNEKIIRTPLMKYKQGNKKVFFKPENLQKYGSFKIRGILNLFNNLPKEKLANGIVSISAGNMGQAIAGLANKYGIDCTIIVPTSIPQNKLIKMEKFNVKIIKKTFDEIWTMMKEIKVPGMEDKYFIHSLNPLLLDGYGNIVDEIVADMPSVKNIVVPFGTGGLSLGIAKRIEKLKLDTKIYAVEPIGTSPLNNFLEGLDNPVARKDNTILDTIGTPSLIDMYLPEFKKYIYKSITISDKEVRGVVKNLFLKNNITVEGSAAASIAAAINNVDLKDTVCIVTGANINPSVLKEIVNENH